MAENPKAEALRRDFSFIQESMATSGLTTIAGHLLRLDLITGENHRDIIEPCGIGPDRKAAMLMTSVEVRIRDNPDVYFTRFIEALRRSHLGNVADRLVQALPEDQRHSTSYDIFTTSNIPSLSGSTQTTATSHNLSSSFTNQSSPRYPIPQNLLPHNPFPPYFLPVQQSVLPPTHPQAYLSNPTILQQWSNPTHAHAPSDFPSPPPNPVHLNQQYSVLPSHTNIPILHQNPSLSYEQQQLPSHSSSPPHLYHHRPSSQPFPLYSSTDPNSVTTAAATATSHHPLNPPGVHSLTSQVSSMTTISENTPILTQSDSTRHLASTPYHTEQSSCQQFVAPHHPRQSYTSTCGAYHSLAPPSPSATTPSGVTAPPSTPAHQHLLSPAMQRYVTYLKNSYKIKTTPVYDKEHRLLQVKAKYFINIALVHKEFSQYMSDNDKNEIIMDRLHGHVDAIQHMKTELLICDICKKQDGDLARSVLVEGAPGVGKTTFAYELCKRWARGEVLWECAAVLLIKLRDHRTRTAQNMYDLLYHPRPEVQQAVVDELIDQDGKGMLLILDGYDELTDSQKESTSVIQLIMSRELLCQSTLMVTSRPITTRALHDNFVQSIDQHIEVLGFTEKNIEEYIQSACGDKPELVEDFKSYLSCHPFSSALMFNPLQCAIVTDLYRTHWKHRDKEFAPKTLTELYTGLVHIMLLRYLTQHPVYKDRYRRITDFSDLPEEVSQQLEAVAELAAEGIEKRQYVFDEVNTNIPSETLGLMQKEEVVASGIGISTSYNFLHLTLQEYLAAVNYSQQYSSPEQLSQLLTRDDLFPLNNFLQYYGDEQPINLSAILDLAKVNYSQQCSSPSEQLSQPLTRNDLYQEDSFIHWPVLLFLAGRTKLRDVSSDIFKTGLDHSGYATTVKVSLLHLLYETQSPQLIQSTLVTSRKYLSVSGSSALDWFVIGYCIANSTSTWRVEKRGIDSPKYFDKLVMGLRLGPEECSGESKIGSLHLTGHWTGNWKILLQLQPYTKSLTEIDLVDIEHWKQLNDQEESRRKSVSEEVLPCYPMLEKCFIDTVEIIYSASLLSFVSQHSNLHILSLYRCNLSSIATSSLIHFLQSQNNRRLRQLTLKECTFQIPDHTNSAAISYYLLKLTSPSHARKFSLSINGSLFAINYIFSQPHLFYTNTLTTLEVGIVSETADSLQTSAYPNLVSLKISSKFEENSTYLKSFLFHSHKNNLCILAMTRIHLSNECFSSLICFLQSPNNRLHKLTLDDCTIQIPDHANSVAVSCQIDSTSTDTGNFSLEITGSLHAIKYMLSQPHQFYANTLAILKVVIVSGAKGSLQIDTSLYPNLNMLDITSKEENHTLLHDSVFYVISQQISLHILSMKRCNLTCDTVRSLIHSLQSSHCGLQELTLNDCISDHTHTTTTSKLQLKSLDSGNVSLEFTGVCCDISHLLSQLSSYTQLTVLILHLKGQDRTRSANVYSLLEILLYHQMLKSLMIEMDRSTLYLNSYAINIPLSIPLFIELQENKLHTLSIKRCNLSINVAIGSLIHSLQSPHCRLHQLTIDHCTVFTHDKTQMSTIATKTNTTLCSLVVTCSLCVLNHILSNVFFERMTDLNLFISSSEAEVLTTISFSCPYLETVKIDSEILPLSIIQFIKSHQNNLQTLSLRRCILSSDVTRSFFHSLQSPNCRLQNLSIRDCIISLPHDDAQQTIILMKTNIALHSLDIFWSVLDQMMSCINPFTQTLTELILLVDNDAHKCTSGVDAILQEIPSKCPLLKTLRIGQGILSSVVFLSPSIPQFIGSKTNNLRTLKLRWCKLTSDVTRLLIHSLQSPHCKLHKLALDDCNISTTDHAQLTTAIVSSTTITHLLFIDENIDTPSLTALASGLKHNATIEQLAVDKCPCDISEIQFQLLIDAVNNSTVKKVWLYNYHQYKTWFRNYKMNIGVNWYSDDFDLYNKW